MRQVGEDTTMQRATHMSGVLRNPITDALLQSLQILMEESLLLK